MALSANGPIDYAGMIQGPDLTGSLAQGLQLGSGIRSIMDERRQQEAAAAQQAQYSADLSATLQNPNPRAFAALIAKYPKQREALGQSWGLLDEDQKNAEFKSGVEVYSALHNNRPDVAIQRLDKHLEAMRNSGQDTSNLENIRGMIERDPKSATGYVGLVLSSTDPDRWGKVMTESRESEMAPAKLSEAQAKAMKAATDAKYAESMAAKDLEKAGWDIWKIGQDASIARQNSQIAAMNAATAREGDDLKRQDLQLKVQEKIAKRDADVLEKAANIEAGRASIDNMLSTADRILKTPLDVVGSAAGPVSSRVPTLSQDTANLEELVNTLGSQAFMAQIPNLKGMGALSNAEGEKLQSALQNLSLRQSPERLLENVQEAQRLMLKSRKTLADRYGVPDTIPDRPALDTQPASSGFRVLGVE